MPADLVSAHAHLLSEEGAGRALLGVGVTGVGDGVRAGVQPSTGSGAGRGAAPTRDRRVQDLGTAVAAQLLVALGGGRGRTLTSG